MTSAARIAFVAVLLLALAPPASLRADPLAPVFGPRQFVRERGRPERVTEHFAACQPDRTFRLRVENGPGPRHRVEEAEIRLNGVTIVRPRDVRHGERDRHDHDRWDRHHEGAVIERPVTLRAENTLSVELDGRPGSAVSVRIVATTPCRSLAVALTSPEAGATLDAPLVLVEGVVRGAAGATVAVNGVPAALEGERFTTLLAVDPAMTEIVAVATAPDGATAEARHSVTVVQAPPPRLVFRTVPAAGPPPLAVRVVMATELPVTRVVLDLGDGRSVTDPALDSALFEYPQPGRYTPRVTVTDASGATSTATTVVEVVDRAAFDAVLQVQWGGLKDALRHGDLDGALGTIATRARDLYRELLGALTVPPSQIDQVLTDITLLDFDEIQAEYEMLRIDNGVTMSYLVLFTRDADGVWRLRFF
jgi:hypothetical protein